MISCLAQLIRSLRQASSLEWALFGGEDYQLVGTIAAEKADELTEIYAQTGKKLWIIGHVTEGSGVWHYGQIKILNKG